MRTAADKARRAATGAGPAPGADPTPSTLPSAWADWLAAQQNRMPLSGDVTQWIKAWSEAVGQVGLLNVNIAGSSDPTLERRIGAQYSYGRQLGRILDVLVPLVAANEGELRKRAGDAAVQDFQDMARRIERMKRRTVDDIVDEVKRWRDGDDFQARLDDLVKQLTALGRAR